MEEVVKQLIYLKPMVATAAVGTIILTIALVSILKNFSFQDKYLKLMGFFYDMKTADCIALSVTLLKFYLVLSLAFIKGNVQSVHIFCYGMLIIIFNLCIRKLKDGVVSIFNGLVIMGVLQITKLLVAYLTNVLFDFKILFALILIGVFLLLYSIYDISCCASSIIDKRSRLEKKLETEVEKK